MSAETGATARRHVPETEQRTIRALREPLSAVEKAPSVFTVYSKDGTPHTVDVESRACTCPDAEYNQPAGGCKHARFARLWARLDPVPEWVNRSKLGFHLRSHLDRVEAEEGRR